MKFLSSTACSLALLFFSLSSVSAADLNREKRMADEIVDAILDGDAVFLKAYEHEFLSIYTEADEPSEAVRGTAIILHGRGFHPDWQDAINPLRVGLAESGWNTLSIQMPVLEKQAKYYDYLPLFPEAIPRIEAAIAYAREQMEADKTSNKSGNKVVLIAHSCGAHMAMAWIETWDAKGEQKIDAYVGLGMGATDYQQPMEKPFPFEKLTVPILDVYGEHDYPGVLRRAPERLQSIEAAGNKKTSQRMVKGANHYYENKGEELTQVINQWLLTL